MSVANIVARLIAAGTPPDVAAMAVTEAFAAGAVCGQSADKADVSAERRREKDRERKRDIRRHSAESADIPQKSEPALTLKDNLKEEKKVRATKGRIPADWNPNAAHFEAAEKLKIPRAAVEAKAEDMRIWAGSTGALKVDWDLTFHGFLRRDAPKLAVHSVGAVMATLTAKSPNWNVWKAHYRDTGQQSKAAMMDRFASEDRPMTFPTELPEQSSTAH